MLTQNRKYLDLSSVEFDGSQTPAKNRGDAVGYQGQKACNTTNALFLSDSQGVMLGMSIPQEGQHHDLFEIQVLFDEICGLLKAAGINPKGLFLKGDPGFDSAEFVAACEIEEVIANVKRNPKNSANSEPSVYESGTHVLMMNCMRTVRSLSIRIPGLIALKPC